MVLSLALHKRVSFEFFGLAEIFIAENVDNTDLELPSS